MKSPHIVTRMGKLDETARQKLIALRLAAGFTQGTVGAAVGWKQTSVSKYELGEINADLDTLAAFARFYDKPLCALLNDADAPPVPEDAAAQRLSELRTVFMKLTDEQQAALLVLLRAQAAAVEKPRPSGPAKRPARRASPGNRAPKRGL